MVDLGVLILKTVILFFISLFAAKIIEKGRMSRIIPFKIVSYILISTVMVLFLFGIIQNVVFAAAVILIWMAMFVSLNYFSLKVKWIHDFLTGKQTVLIKDGKVMEKNLGKVFYTGEDFLEVLRSKGVFNLSDVQFAVMESNGDVNLLLKPDKKSVTPRDLKIDKAPICEPETVIMDGNILDGALARRGLNRQWLNAELSKSGVSMQNVFIAQVDSSGDLFIDTFDDSVEVKEPKVKELLYANISKAYADLFSYSLETENIDAKKMYSNNANTIKRVMNKLEAYLLN